MLRAIRGETRQRRDHLSVFREFLSHLERVGRRAARNGRTMRHAKPNGRSSGKR
jgi:hypothetical protein